MPMRLVDQMEEDVYNPEKLFNEKIRELIKSTQPKEGPIKVEQDGKRFRIIRDNEFWKGYEEMHSSDTIGTKGSIHWKMDSIEHAVTDAVAMVADDLIETGHTPVMFHDVLVFPEEDHAKYFRAVDALVRHCMRNKWQLGKSKKTPILITGGETTQASPLDGLDIVIFGIGYAKKGHGIRCNAQKGDTIIGLESNGVHCNGLSFFREELFNKRKMPLDNELPWGPTVGEELTKPTNIYLPAIKMLINSLESKEKMIANEAIHGMVHITGGGLSKLKELIPNKDVNIEVLRGHKLVPQPIFRYAHDELGVSSDKMYTRFNNGIGYVIAVDQSVRKEALAVLGKRFKTDEIGAVTAGRGRVLIESEYEPKVIEYQA